MRTFAHWWLLVALASVSLFHDKIVSQEAHSSKLASPMMSPYRVEEKCIFREPFGLQVGDQILAVNGESFQNPVAILEQAYKAKQSGGRVVLECSRSGKKFTVFMSAHDMENMSSRHQKQ